MLTPILTPYLPTGQVKVLVAGEGVRGFSSALDALGLSVLYTAPIAALPKALYAHTDLAVCPLKNRQFFLDNSQTELYSNLQAFGCCTSYGNQKVQSGYPQDVPYNALQLGAKFLLCNKKTVASSILQYAIAENCVILNCRQGYTKCSVAPIRENAVMTDDKSIAEILLKNDFDVLLLEKGDILLHGFQYGFIGGCCTMISKSEMLFLGDMRSHRNADAIQAFLKNYGISPICAGKTPLTDIGSLIPLLQEEKTNV
ncbi:MAG: DUF6873 family GME fold protein [Candidatus Fimenecus sp.]